MELVDIIIIAILGLIATGILIYIRRQKKKGSKCIGCPYGGKCNGSCSSNE